MACRLCMQSRPLMKSHIFPEWLYTPLYDKNHRFFVLGTNENRRRGTRSKGIYERLLCQECEVRMSKWEGYAREVFYGDDPRIRRGKYGKTIVLSGLRYAPFKLFQMSLIWRASIANRQEVHKIDLGPHAERLREMLLEECPGECYEYGTILMLPTASLDEITREFVYPPERIPGKIDGHTAYRAIFAELIWLFIVSNHSVELQDKNLFLSKDGRLPIRKVGEPAVEFLRKLARDFSKAGMLNQPH